MSSLFLKDERSEAQASTLSTAAYRSLDVLIATAALLVSLPVLILACAAIRLESPGPAIFRQRRLGRGKLPFTVHKLRTMGAEADPAVHRAYRSEEHTS